MVQGIERDADDRLDDLERDIHGTEDDPGLWGIINGVPEKRRGMLEVLGDHERRIKALEPPTGQPRDWFLVTDKEVATQWLDELDQWRGRVLNHIQPSLLDKPCWLWHPTVVARLIVLQGVWVSAKRPDQAAVLWTRYLTDLTKGINDAGGIDKCGKDRRHKGLGCGHVEELPDGTERSDWVLTETATDADWDMLRNDYITWWCGVREGVPPGLMPA